VLFLASLIVHLLLLVGSPILLGLTAKVKRLIPEDPFHFSQGTVEEVLVVVVAVVIVFVVVVIVVVSLVSHPHNPFSMYLSCSQSIACFCVADVNP